MDRDEVKWELQKWEKEVDAETILHPTPSVNRVPPNSIPSEIAVGTHPTPSVNVGGQSVIRCGMRRVPFHNADRRWLNHGHVALWNARPLICLLHHR